MLRSDEVIPFTAGDGVELNLVHVRGEHAPTRGPVLLVHGAGVRANIFRAPSGRTLVDALVVGTQSRIRLAAVGYGHCCLPGSLRQPRSASTQS